MPRPVRIFEGLRQFPRGDEKALPTPKNEKCAIGFIPKAGRMVRPKPEHERPVRENGLYFQYIK